MKVINKRLIVSDFDGTLLTNKQTIPDRVRLAIEEYVNSGGIFAVCTGRMLISILPRVRELALKGLVVAYQGGVIADIESGKILKKDFLNYLDCVEICTYLKEINQNINIYCDEVLYTDTPKENSYLHNYEIVTGVEATQVKNVVEHVEKNKLNCQKIACLVPTEDREWVYRKILEKFGNRFDITCSAAVLVEISPLNNNKGQALKYLAKHLNIPLESTVAIGDNLNDLSMIEVASIGVAVGNAVSELKEVANYIAATNNDGAVAEVIEKFGFNND